MPFPWGAALGAAGSIFSGVMQGRAAKRAATQMRNESERAYRSSMELAAPFLTAGRRGLAGTTALAGEYGSKLGKPSALIGAAHEVNVGRIGRGTERAVRGAGSFWGSKGDPLRARGETIRARETGIDRMNAENLQAAGMQENYMDRNAGMYGNLMGRMISGGGMGIGPAMSGINARMQGGIGAAQTVYGAEAGFWDDMGSLFGIPIGDWQADRDAKRAKKP